MAIVVIKLHKPAPIAANSNAPIGRRIALPTDLSTPRPRAVNASAAVPMRRASVRSNQRGAATIRLSINCVSASFSAFFGPLVAPGFSDRISEMQAVADNGLMLALFSLGGGEMILILAAVLILFGANVMMGLNRFKRAPQVRLTHQNQIVERLPNFSDVAFRVRVAQRRMRGCFEDAQLVDQ